MIKLFVYVSKFSGKKKTKNKGGKKNPTRTTAQEVVSVDEHEWVHNCVQKVQQSIHNICAMYTRTQRHMGAVLQEHF